MSLKGPETETFVKIPETDRAVLRRRDELGGLIDLDMLDCLGVSGECEAFARLKVPDLDGRIGRSAGQQTAVEVEVDHTLGVPFEGTDALTGVIIPDAKGVIHRTRHEFCIVKLKGLNRS